MRARSMHVHVATRVHVASLAMELEEGRERGPEGHAAENFVGAILCDPFLVISKIPLSGVYPAPDRR